MSRNEDITTAIWSDPDFETLTPDAKLLYIWSFTNDHNNMAGLYKVSERTMRFETGLSDGRLAAALAEVTAARFLSLIDNVMFVRTRVRHIRAKTAQVARSVAKAVENIPAGHPQRRVFLRLYGDEEWLREALSGLAGDVQEMPVGFSETDDLTVENARLVKKPINIEPPIEPLMEVPVAGTGTGTGLSLSPSLDVVSDSHSGSGHAHAALDLAGRAHAVRELFDEWREKCGHPDAKLTADRRRKIEARLAEGYTAEQISQAIDGAARAAFVNENGKRFDDIELICRNGSKLESFIERANATSTHDRVVPFRRPSAGDLIREITENEQSRGVSA